MNEFYHVVLLFILDYTVFLWDAEAALCLANFVGPDQHIQGVLAVDINHEGTFIVSGG
ncbi:unnamed protein product, partial [Rotaria magnacalcarata]